MSFASNSISIFPLFFGRGRFAIAIVSSHEADDNSPRSFSATKPLSSPLALAAQETLRLTLTIKNDVNTARPHQAFLLVSDATGLETFFPLSIKGESGKAKVELSHKDLPAHLLAADDLSLSIALGSFGSTPGSIVKVGTLRPALDVAAKSQLEKQKLKDLGEGAIVYKAKDEIRHTFRADPTSPPVTITLVFTAAVLASLLGLFIAVSPPSKETNEAKLISITVVPYPRCQS